MCATRVYQFPTPDDRMALLHAVQVFLQTEQEHTRTQMIDEVVEVLGRYHVSHMHLPDFDVAVDAEYVHILARRMIPDQAKECLVCGSDICGPQVSTLSVARAEGRVLVTYGCHVCGSVFGQFVTKD